MLGDVIWNSEEMIQAHNKLPVYIGFDSRERQAYDVARQSILYRTNDKKTRVYPIELSNPDIAKLLTRPIEQKDGKMWCPISEAPMATEFAVSRFCVPFLCRKGWALFVDCDVLCLADIAELFALADDQYAVMVVKHDYQPSETTKMDGQVQTMYSRKNWSSLVLWNCSHLSNWKLTPEVLNTWPGRDLHAFKWLSDDEIGVLPNEWNYLVGVNHMDTTPKLLHYTLGTPNIAGYENCEYAAEWKAEYSRVLGSYGNSGSA